MRLKEMIAGALIGTGYIVGIALILVGFAAYLCIADTTNELLNAAICVSGLGLGGLICHHSDKLAKKYPRWSGNSYEDR